MNQAPGWHNEIISWCKREAERQNLKDHDYWGGFVIDEMKIQVCQSFMHSDDNLYLNVCIFYM